MRRAVARSAVVLSCAALLAAGAAWAADWPQWRGPNRDNKALGFTPPAKWPESLTQKWKVQVGTSDASPVLAGGKVYAFSRQGGQEVLTCLDAGTGKIAWQDKYDAAAVRGPASGHPGPRATPVVGEGKVCALGVTGTLSCLDADSGKVVWRKETGTYPTYYTSSSPLIADGYCVAFLGGKRGDLTALDLNTGDARWNWTAGETPYGSPVLMTVGGVKQIVTLTGSNLVGVNFADGKLLWQVPFQARSNTATPIIDGDRVICSQDGVGTLALQVEKKGDGFEAKKLWEKQPAAHRYNTPVLREGLLYGLTPAGRRGTNIFCMDAKTGELLWKDDAARGECGTIISAGDVLVELSTDKNLVVFEPSPKGFMPVAAYRVADAEPWGAPILDGNRVFVQDRDSVALWQIE